ncbi:hypothetical protein OG875_14790 [Streptomyces sp. NBC_01498]|uniref:hypothetical protein n=1 Tax=Streptomyces sp. NBC_01498 TaxID=2975870 RepID=UPI002E7AD503|nr:hypothetical protein [Streptomyces sp. NBC_01498]WTL25753.1 hypothetical protein OG875_14790 [Streptomyces sp. NBC_01498]
MASQAPTSTTGPRHARPSGPARPSRFAGRGTGRRTGRGTGPRRRRIPPHLIAVPVALGILYGVWAPFIQRHGTPLNALQITLGVVSGLALAILVFGLLRLPRTVPRELRAAAYAVVAGGSVGFLHSLTYASVLRSSGIGLAVGGATAIATFYFFHTREP